MDKLTKEYLAWKGTYAPRACVNYKIWLERFVAVCGDKAVGDYDVTDIIKYRTWLETRYGGYSIEFATIVIKNFFQYCKIQNYPCLSPSLIKLPRFIAKSHRAITEAEFNKVISVIPTHDFIRLRDMLVIRLLWDTGVRVSELRDLDISQIDEIKRSAVIQTKKNGKHRVIVWSHETHSYLMKYMCMRLKLERGSPSSSLLVGWHRQRGWSSRLTSRSIQRTVEYYVDRAGIKEKITPHSFRHGWAHKRRDKNAPLAFIQRGLGHANPISTFVYEQYNDVDFVNSAMRYLKNVSGSLTMPTAGI